MANFSKYQQSIINNYYKNREAISLQKLQESVTELYLAEGKKRQKQWERMAGHLEKLGMKEDRIKYLVDKDDPALIAQVVTELMNKAG